MPVALMTAAAPGEARNLNNTMAASSSLAVVTIPAEIAFVACRSTGRGPSSLAPGTNTISLISWMPSSASPLATISALEVVAARAQPECYGFRNALVAGFDVPGMKHALHFRIRTFSKGMLPVWSHTAALR